MIPAASSTGFEWDGGTLDRSAVCVSLPEAAVNEVRASRHRLQDLSQPGALAALERLPSLRASLSAIRTESIDGAPGFCVIKSELLADLTPAEQRGLFLITVAAMGRTLVQNAAGEHLVEVFDRGTTMAAGGRYHQTNASGVLHSDSPQWPVVPDYVALLCVRTARRGGESKFISAYSVLRRMNERYPDLVEELGSPFLFDKRGDFAEGEPPVTAAPIVSFSEGRLHFRYLRSYIDSGHRLMGEPLTRGQQAALDALDQVLAAEDLVVTLMMEPGDIQVLNNHFVVHDRWPFEDYEEPERRRLMLRAWLQRT